MLMSQLIEQVFLCIFNILYANYANEEKLHDCTMETDDFWTSQTWSVRSPSSQLEAELEPFPLLGN